MSRFAFALLVDTLASLLAGVLLAYGVWQIRRGLRAVCHWCGASGFFFAWHLCRSHRWDRICGECFRACEDIDPTHGVAWCDR